MEAYSNMKAGKILTRITHRQWIVITLLAITCIASMVFVNHNAGLYGRTIAEVTDTKTVDTENVTDIHDNKDTISTQTISGEILNGPYKGKKIDMSNEYSSSEAYDQKYEEGNEVFVSIDEDSLQEDGLTGAIIDAKRDKYVLAAAWVFLFLLLIVGRKRGALSIVSLVVNAALMYFALDLYIANSDGTLLFICSGLVILFSIGSLLFLNGFNQKTYAAILSTLIGISVSLAIAYFVIQALQGNGLRYEEMQYLTRPYREVFMAGLFIGSLGAVMDVSITIASSLFGLYEKDAAITGKALWKSGMDIGKDVMGTLTSILFFVYAAGSIPSILLYLKNTSPLGFTLSMNLSLEIARALVGGIGIVLTIPISVYTTLFIINAKRKRS